jgi:hypothetical protein
MYVFQLYMCFQDEYKVTSKSYSPLTRRVTSPLLGLIKFKSRLYRHRYKRFRVFRPARDIYLNPERFGALGTAKG